MHIITHHPVYGNAHAFTHKQNMHYLRARTHVPSCTHTALPDDVSVRIYEWFPGH